MLLRENFRDGNDIGPRKMIEGIEAMDHVKRKHLLPTFMSKMASLDTN